MKNLLFLSIISLILLGCTKEEKEIIEEIDFFPLETETHNFYPHDDSSNLVFKNQDEEERSLIVKESKLTTVWDYLNRGGRYLSEFRRLRLVWDSSYVGGGQFLIDMKVPESDVAPYRLVDLMSINYSHKISTGNVTTYSSVSLKIITSYRGHNSIDYDSFWNTEQPEFREEVVLLNETYANVYITTNTLGIKVYYSKTHGILAFDDLYGNLWLFSHVEE